MEVHATAVIPDLLRGCLTCFRVHVAAHDDRSGPGERLRRGRRRSRPPSRLSGRPFPRSRTPRVRQRTRAYTPVGLAYGRSSGRRRAPCRRVRPSEGGRSRRRRGSRVLELAEPDSHTATVSPRESSPREGAVAVGQHVAERQVDAVGRGTAGGRFVSRGDRPRAREALAQRQELRSVVGSVLDVEAVRGPGEARAEQVRDERRELESARRGGRGWRARLAHLAVDEVEPAIGEPDCPSDHAWGQLVMSASSRSPEPLVVGVPA